MFAFRRSTGRFPGKVARFSVDVREDTRTMHTEVDVPNPQRVLLPGLYADAELQLDRKDNVPTVPVQALNHERDKTTVFVVNRMDELEERTVQARTGDQQRCRNCFRIERRGAGRGQRSQRAEARRKGSSAGRGRDGVPRAKTRSNTAPRMLIGMLTSSECEQEKVYARIFNS